MSTTDRFNRSSAHDECSHPVIATTMVAELPLMVHPVTVGSAAEPGDQAAALEACGVAAQGTVGQDQRAAVVPHASTVIGIPAGDCQVLKRRRTAVLDVEHQAGVIAADRHQVAFAYLAQHITHNHRAQLHQRSEKTLKSIMPQEAKKAFGAGIRITRDRAGRLSLREDTEGTEQ